MKEKRIDRKIISTPAVVKPFMYTRPSVSSVSIRFLVLLLLQVVLLALTRSYSALGVVLTALLGAAGASAVSYLLFREPLYNAFGILIQGLMTGLLLPETYSLGAVFFITFLTLLVSRCVIGRAQGSPLNETALAVIIAWFVGRSYFPQFGISADLLQLKNSSSYLIQNGTFPVYGFDTAVTAFLNGSVLRALGVSLPEGIISLFCDSRSVIPAFRFNLLTILSSLLLFSDNAFSGIIPSLFLAVYALLVRLFVPLLFGGAVNQGDILLAFLTGGTLFCAVFMLQWFGTVPMTRAGKIVLGVLSGITAFLLMGCGTSPVGMVYTVFVCNILTMIIRMLEERQNETVAMNVLAKVTAAKGESK